MDTTTILPNVHKDHHISTTTTATTTANNPLKRNKSNKAEPVSKLKCVRKKRSVGKKDRQSKIHTAQGLRDRRMRLSVHTARKFFDLNDMLGFDKASKTIEWLFNKSQKAIKEVETLQSQAAADQAVSSETDQSVMEITAAKEKDVQIEDDSSTKPQEHMSKNVGKMKQLFQPDPSDDFHQSQLSFDQDNHDELNMKESSCYPLEFSNTYHFLKHLHLDNSVRNTNTNTDTYNMGNISSISSTNHSIFDYTKTIGEPPTCWLNSRNPFFGLLGGYSENPRMESNNRVVTNMASLNGNMSSSFINFHSENRGQ